MTTVIIIAGPSGSGKTFVCNKIQNYPVVHWDKLKVRKHFLEVIKEQPGDLVFLDLPMLVSTNIKKLIDAGFDVKLICINETPEVIKSRLESRGGQFTDAVGKRIVRFQRLAKKAWFYGTSDQVIQRLTDLGYFA